jgi:hypothetical protein
VSRRGDRVFPSKSELPTGTEGQDLFPSAPPVLDVANPLHRALQRLGKVLESKKGAAPNGAAKGYSM